MLRYRIYPIALLESWKSLSNNLLSLKYTDEATRGIKLIDISSTSITGTYYEKIQYNETINHPVNGIETIIQESFLYTDFFIDNDSMVFILVNPSRRPNSVFKFLSINSHNVLSIKTSNINISQFCSFAKTALKDFRVKKIFFVPFNFSQKSTASISISSIDDAIEDSSQLGVDLPKNIQKIYFDCRHYNKKISGIITAAGSISVSSTAGSDFFDQILRAVI